MARDQWPRVKVDIDRGHPSPLGLVRVKSWNPLDLKFNHQVLAYGYEREDDLVTLRVYDPNRAADDEVTISFQLSDLRPPVPVRSTLQGRPVYSFFRVRYRPMSPP